MVCFTKNHPDIEYVMICRDVSTGATGATAVAPKFSDTLTLYPPGGQILPTITEFATKFSPWLRPWYVNKINVYVSKIYPIV